MRKANNKRNNKEKSCHRKKQKINNFCNGVSTSANLIYVFREYLIAHKKAWEESIINDDGYLKPYYKGLITKTINKANNILEIIKNLGFVIDTGSLDKVNTLLKKEVFRTVTFFTDDNKYTNDILKSAISSSFSFVSLKRYYKKFNKSKYLCELIQEMIDIGTVYFNFFEKDIQKL